MFAQLARTYRALGDPTRLRIVNLLLHEGELSVGDVEAILNISQSKASRHMVHLRQAGIVQDRREGTWVFYRIALRTPEGVRASLRDIQKALVLDAGSLRDLERAKALKQAGKLAAAETKS